MVFITPHIVSDNAKVAQAGPAAQENDHVK
jgi:hypothetical protein